MERAKRDDTDAYREIAEWEVAEETAGDASELPADETDDDAFVERMIRPQRTGRRP